MDIKAACKLISYLSDKIEKENNLEECCWESVARVSHKLKEYGFKKVEGIDPISYHSTGSYFPFVKEEIPCDKPIDGCVDLFTINGNPRLFGKTDLKKRYFNWYSKGIKEREINDLLNKKKR